MAESPTFDVHQIAKLLNLDTRRVQQLAAEGWIPQHGRGRYGLVESVHGYIRYLKEHGRETSRGTEHSRLARAQAVKVELSNYKAMGELQVTSQVEETTQGLVVMMKSLHEGLPGRLSSELAGISEPPVIYQRLQAELRAVVNSCADYLEKRAEALSAMQEPGAAAPPAEGSDAGAVG